MPHRCSECKKTYAENAPEILQGCTCGNRVFQFIKGNGRLNRIKTTAMSLAQVVSPVNASIQTQVTIDKPTQVSSNFQLMQQEVNSQSKEELSEDILLTDETTENHEAPHETIIYTTTLNQETELDPAENIKVLEPGSYELDIERLMKGEPVTVKTENEVYFVSFKVKKEKKKKR